MVRKNCGTINSRLAIASSNIKTLRHCDAKEVPAYVFNNSYIMNPLTSDKSYKSISLCCVGILCDAKAAGKKREAQTLSNP